MIWGHDGMKVPIIFNIVLLPCRMHMIWGRVTMHATYDQESRGNPTQTVFMHMI